MADRYLSRIEARICSKRNYGLKIPPFEMIKGNKYIYPKNKTEWKFECKKAINYKKKRWKAICKGTSYKKVTKRNIYYETLLRGLHNKKDKKQMPPIKKTKYKTSKYLKVRQLGKKTTEKIDPCGTKDKGFTIPPFHVIKGTRYKYPQNKTEWDKECKKGVAYQRKRWKALCERKPDHLVPPRSYYYERLLQHPKAIAKGKQRRDDRAEAIKRGLLPKTGAKNIHIHHIKYGNKRVMKILSKEEHDEIHRNERKSKRPRCYHCRAGSK